MAENTEKRRERRSESRTMKRRRRNVLLLLGELALCLVLGIGAVICQRTINQMYSEELDDNVYIETLSPRKTDAPATSMSKSISEVTDASGNVIDRQESDIPVYTDPNEYRNFLILGLDTRMDPNELQNTDVIMIASLNNTTGEIKLVSVLRDTILRLEDGSITGRIYDKCNEQYYTGISQTVSMINRNLGLDIKEYAVVTWYGVAMCINQLGPIEMTIHNLQEMEWHQGYLRSTCEAIGIEYEPEVLWGTGDFMMDGPQVVAYCRIRYGGLNDWGRAKNQREAVEKILNKAKEVAKAGDFNRILNCAETALSNVKTNLSLPDVAFLASDISRYKMAGSYQFPAEGRFVTKEKVGNYDLSYPIVVNNFEYEVRELHKFLFPDLEYEPSEFIKEVSWQMYIDRTGQ